MHAQASSACHPPHTHRNALAEAVKRRTDEVYTRAQACRWRCRQWVRWGRGGGGSPALGRVQSLLMSDLVCESRISDISENDDVSSPTCSRRCMSRTSSIVARHLSNGMFDGTLDGTFDGTLEGTFDGIVGVCRGLAASSLPGT